MDFAVFCMGLIALAFGAAVVFAGYRLFLVLLPIWGFFAGLFLGAQAVTLIFGDAFLATITGLVVGFIVGAIFAVLSYLFYVFAVAILSFSAGYGLGVAIWEWIFNDFGFIGWIIAVVLGVIVALVVLRFNIQKYAIIVITAVGGTSAIIFVLLAAFGNTLVLALLENPVKTAINNNFLWLLFFLVVAGAGIVVQIRANRNWEIESYDRWAGEEEIA